MRLEELSLAALGQLCPQHQAWANSFPRPCAAMVPGAQRDTSAPSCMSGSRESPRKVPASDSGGSGGAQTHRSAVLVTQSDKHCLSLSESGKNLNLQTSWRERKAAKKSFSN